MNALRYKYILYTIIFVTLCTIGIQAYWNYKNYLNSKQQLINDVQVSLDKAVDDYYASLAKETSFSLAIATDSKNGNHRSFSSMDSIIHQIDSTQRRLKFKTDTSSLKSINIIKGTHGDTTLKSIENFDALTLYDSTMIGEWSTELSIDTLFTEHIGTLTSKVFLSVVNDSLNLKTIDSLVSLELQRKNLSVDFHLEFDHPRHIINYSEKSEHKLSLNESQKSAVFLSTHSKSTFLPQGSTLTILFTNTSEVILNRMLGGILISSVLILAVISCLFYLLKIIRHQKQLAEVKNDLISNITHEFKTPIATISVALESIKDFNGIDDKQKTMSYIDMSNDQLNKLNTMVEKLLETSTLDSENLKLNKERIDIVELIQLLVDNYNLQKEGTPIICASSSKSVFAMVDAFHFENTINNILDNAVKYGGDDISVEIKHHMAYISISISDSGHSLNKTNKDKIFEKFYRVPKGNTHDVKGFGIGLYYTKKIIEKHDGIIQLILDGKSTTFQITLPNE